MGIFEQKKCCPNESERTAKPEASQKTGNPGFIDRSSKNAKIPKFKNN
jgi:hypothetical protein